MNATKKTCPFCDGLGYEVEDDDRYECLACAGHKEVYEYAQLSTTSGGCAAITTVIGWREIPDEASERISEVGPPHEALYAAMREVGFGLPKKAA